MDILKESRDEPDRDGGHGAGNTGAAVGDSPAHSPQGDSRFKPGNPWRWPKGRSGNPHGRPRCQPLPPDLADLPGRVMNLESAIAELRRRRWPQRDGRFAEFVALYTESGNAYQSALEAGYSPSFAKSKSYALARQVRRGMGDEV